MKRKLKNSFVAFCCFLAMSLQTLSGQTSAFNKLSINDSAGEYSFIVSGHFHGASTNYSGFPASTLLAGIDTLNALKPAFIISLGDIFLDVDDASLANYQRSLFSKLSSPMFNAVGNHDRSNGNKYEEVFGKTFFSFSKGSEIFIVLNTEIDNGSIKDEQLEMFVSVLKSAEAATVKNVFVFSHRPLWAENDTRYKDLFRGNTRNDLGISNYGTEIKPLIEKLDKPVYWMSGSTAGGPSSFFYDRYPDTKITFIQSAIRDLPRDAVLQVNVKEGVIVLNGVSLTGQALEPVQNYGIEFWLKNYSPEEKFNYRLIPYLTVKMLKHYYFWIGFVSSLVFVFILLSIYKRWKKRR